MPPLPNATTRMVWPASVATVPPLATVLRFAEKRGSEPSSVYQISSAPAAVTVALCEAIATVHAYLLPSLPITTTASALLASTNRS